jgi:hypothetical protein
VARSVARVAVAGTAAGSTSSSTELVAKAKELLEVKIALQTLFGDEEAIDDHFIRQLNG